MALPIPKVSVKGGNVFETLISALVIVVAMQSQRLEAEICTDTDCAYMPRAQLVEHRATRIETMVTAEQAAFV